MSEQLSVLLAGSTRVSRAVLRAALETSPAIELDEVEQIPYVIRKLNTEVFDVILFDLNEPPPHFNDILHILERYKCLVAILVHPAKLDEVKSYHRFNNLEILLKHTGYLTALPYYLQNKRSVLFEPSVEHIVVPALMGNLLIDRFRKILSISPGAEQLFGCKKGEIQGRQLSEFIKPASLNTVYNNLEEARKNHHVRLFKIGLPESAVECSCILTPNVDDLNNSNTFRCELYQLPHIQSQRNLDVLPKLPLSSLQQLHENNKNTEKYLKELIGMVQNLELDVGLHYLQITGHDLKINIRASSVVALEQEIGTDALTSFIDKLFMSSDAYYVLQIPSKLNVGEGYIAGGLKLSSFNDLQANQRVVLLTIKSIQEWEANYVKISNFFNNLMICLKIATAMRATYNNAYSLKQYLITSQLFRLDLPMRNLLRETAWTLKFAFKLEAVAIGLFDSKDDKFGFYAVASESREVIAELLSQRLDPDFVKQHLKKNPHLEKTLAPEKILSNMLFPPSSQQAAHYYCVPLQLHDKQIMGLIFYSVHLFEKKVEQALVGLIEIVAHQIGVGIGNKIHFNKSLKSTKEKVDEKESTKKTRFFPLIGRLLKSDPPRQKAKAKTVSS